MVYCVAVGFSVVPLVVEAGATEQDLCERAEGWLPHAWPGRTLLAYHVAVVLSRVVFAVIDI